MDPHTNNRDGIWSQSNESADESQNEKMRETKLVDLSLLSIEEMEWLNSYHSQVWEKLISQVSPLLEGSARQWLWKNTRPIAKQ
ncbi:hypothetical protein Goarm_017412 [Gossypium armourianum]|uniref:Peptidase M24 C-terminal domain-containing protein n=1 Tax=Gossypium armourianum TaxID=34283 RepID=A0A7J9JGV7_9ROSI|nr:hypothetical protein [Gossypium armourianum]